VQEAVDAAPQFNHTLLFGHYPRVTSMNRVPWESLTEGKVLAYLCGHLHTDGMYTNMPQDYFELELEDMKSHKKYRILAFDHDLFTFQDFYLQTWPAIVVTNPKSAYFYSNLEPLDLIAQSTHIRVLVFSPNPVVSVAVFVDGEFLGNMTQAANGSSLYVLPWLPSALGPGLHTMVVEAADTDGPQKVSIPFSVDRTVAAIQRSDATVMQHVPIHAFVQGTFSVLYIYSFGVILLFSKFWGRRNRTDAGSEAEYAPLFEKPPPQYTLGDALKAEVTEKLLTYSYLSRWHWRVMVVFWVNLVVGPLVIGPIVDAETYGAVFIWGAAANVSCSTGAAV
jgi:hypothetical protein